MDKRKAIQIITKMQSFPKVIVQGILREELVYTKETSHLILTFGEQALVQLQGDEYFCPTCEKILKMVRGERTNLILQWQRSHMEN